MKLNLFNSIIMREMCTALSQHVGSCLVIVKTSLSRLIPTYNFQGYHHFKGAEYEYVITTKVHFAFIELPLYAHYRHSDWLSN